MVDDSFVAAGGPLARKLGAVIELTGAELACIGKMQGRLRSVAAGNEIVHDGEASVQTYVVKEGWAIRFKTLSDGRRQVIGFALPGDFIGLFSGLFAVADHSVAALTDLEVHPIEPAGLVATFGTCPRLGAAIGWTAGRDVALLCEQVTRVGRRSAYERTGHLIVELLHRLRLVGEAEANSFTLPLTQEILADTLGLSVVHVNRTLRRLRENGLLYVNRDRVVISDLDRLVKVADFSPHYLAAQPLPPAIEAALHAPQACQH